MKPWLLIPIVVNQNNNKHVGFDDYGSFTRKMIFQKEKVRERKKWCLRETRGMLDYRNEAHPLPWWEEGIYSFTRETPRMGCGAGKQWVKTRSFFRGVTSTLKLF